MTRKRNHFQDKYSINLHYIRAAIEANTGQRLTLERVRELLVEEGLITKSQAERNAQLFTGYSDFYDDTTESRKSEDNGEIKEIVRGLKNDRWEMKMNTKYKVAKVERANCGASVRAAAGGYMSVSGNGIDINQLEEPKAGYSKGGYASKKKKKSKWSTRLL